jgi:hypothetical protein
MKVEKGVEGHRYVALGLSTKELLILLSFDKF